MPKSTAQPAALAGERSAGEWRERCAVLERSIEDISQALKASGTGIVVVGPDLRITRFLGPLDPVFRIDGESQHTLLTMAHTPLYGSCENDLRTVIATRSPLTRRLDGGDGCTREVTICPDENSGGAVVTVFNRGRTVPPPTQGDVQSNAGAHDLDAIAERTFIEIRHDEEPLRSATDAADVGLVMLDRNRRYVFANRQYAGILGLSDVDLVGKTTAEVFGTVDLDRISAILDRAFAGERLSYEIDRQSADGKALYYAVVIEPLRDDASVVTNVVGVIYDITKNKLAQMRIGETEERLRLANEAAGIGIFDIDLTTATAHYSPELSAILGIPHFAAVPLQLAFQRIHREDVGRVLAQFQSAQQSDSDRRLLMEFRFVRPGGEVRWMTWIGQVKFSDTASGPRATRVLGACVDITDRRRAESDLRESEARYRGVVEGSLQGIVIQQNERILYANRAMAAIFGYDQPHELIGKSTFDDFIAEEERPLLRTRTAATYRGETLKPHGGWRGFRRDGTEIWVASMAHKVEWQGGPAVVSFYIDITERKKAEMRLNEALWLTKVACEAGQMGTWHFDPATGRLNYSDEGLALLGIDKTKWDGSLGAIEAVVHPDDVERRRAAIRRGLAERTNTEFEFRIVRPNGEIRWMLVRGHPLKRPDSGKLEALGVVVDMTERKRDEQRQQMLTRELDHRVKNTLARVLVILQRSSERASTVEDLSAAIEGRIQALAQAHSLLSRHTWRGARLADLITVELEPYATATNTIVDGPDLVLTPDATQAVTLVLHELATNAAKYGALSTSRGRVRVHWRYETRAPAQPQLVIEWEERGGPAVVKPDRKGYGSSVIGELIPYEMGGAVDIQFRDEGVVCVMSMPLARAKAPDDPATPSPPS